MANIYFTITIILALIVLILLYLLLKVKKELDEATKSQEELRHDFRSMNVKHGNAWEKFVPFMPEFEKIANKENAVFLGMPIDLISFDEDFVKFIEVKTGKSKLSEKQEKIKKLIEEKKVKWFELRYEKKD